MEAVLWSDYLCPWCYLGRDRTALLESLGVTVTHLPFELHPEIPAGGYRIDDRSDGRRARFVRLYEHIGAECAELGIPFQRPRRVPNTRRVLATAEWVRRHEPEVFPRLDGALFEAHFVEGADLGDPEVVDALVTASGGDAERARTAVDTGRMWPVLDAAREQAVDAGVTGTPAWLVDRRLLIPGVQSRDWIHRVIRKMASV